MTRIQLVVYRHTVRQPHTASVTAFRPYFVNSRYLFHAETQRTAGTPKRIPPLNNVITIQGIFHAIPVTSGHFYFRFFGTSRNDRIKRRSRTTYYFRAVSHDSPASGLQIFRFNIIFSCYLRVKAFIPWTEQRINSHIARFFIQDVAHLSLHIAQSDGTSAQRYASAHTVHTIGYRHVSRFVRNLQCRIQIQPTTAALVFRIYTVTSGNILPFSEIHAASGPQNSIQRGDCQALYLLQNIIHAIFRKRQTERQGIRSTRSPLLDFHRQIPDRLVAVIYPNRIVGYTSREYPFPLFLQHIQSGTIRTVKPVLSCRKSIQCCHIRSTQHILRSGSHSGETQRNTVIRTAISKITDNAVHRCLFTKHDAAVPGRTFRICVPNCQAILTQRQRLDGYIPIHPTHLYRISQGGTVNHILLRSTHAAQCNPPAIRHRTGAVIQPETGQQMGCRHAVNSMIIGAVHTKAVCRHYIIRTVGRDIRKRVPACRHFPRPQGIA